MSSAMPTTVTKTITLHIGTEKTGTSTLQKQFDMNRDLLKKAGVLYPVAGGPRVHSALKQLALAEPARKKPKKNVAESAEPPLNEAELMAELRREIEQSGCRHVLFSHEHFSSRLRNAESIGRLVAAMRTLAEEVKVVVFIRPQYDLFGSIHSTWVIGGGKEPAVVPDKAKRLFYDYDRMLRLWENAVGIANVTVRRFGRKYFKDGDLTATFFDALGMETPAGYVLSPPRNTSFDAPTLEFLRLLNIHAEGMADGSANEFRRDAIKGLRRLSQPGSPIVAASVLQGVDELCAESNQRVVDRYFAGKLDRLFEPFDASAYKAVVELTPSRAVEMALMLFTKAKQLPKSEKKQKPRPEKKRDAKSERPRNAQSGRKPGADRPKAGTPQTA